ncbi:MAG: hypothetical protein KC501_18985 [Myxococcales bacterium]|nr:hypothetical protein [Myxococcales bacterium]
MPSLRFVATSLCAGLLLTACPGPAGEDSDGGTGTETTGPGDGSSTTGNPMTSATDSTGSADDSGSSGPEPGTDSGSETGPICEPGTANCVCVDGACDGDLLCVGDVCTEPGGCGDGVVDEGEECDDGNPDDGDGCESDCTFTPGAAAVDAGSVHTCALLHRGAVRCWGDGTNGRLGYGNTDHIGDDELPSAAGDVDVGGTAVQIALGSNFSCALLDDGDLRCWGANSLGQLGLGHTGPVGDNLLPGAFPPVDIDGPALQIAAGLDHACALRDTGEVYCWGNNNAGQLGYGNVTDIGDDEDPAVAGPVSLGAPATAVVAGGSFSCALLDTGELRCWGEGVSGRLGSGSTADIGDDELPDSVPAVDLDGATIVELSAGDAHVCVRTDADEAICWGEANFGRLGYGNTSDVGDDEPPTSMGPVSLAGPASALGLGETHSCAVVGGGELRCWGEATNGRIGNGNASLDVGDDELPSDVPIVAVGAQVRSVAGGGAHTCAVTMASEVRCWGRSNRGQLGYGDTTTIGDDELPDTVGVVQIE